MIWPAYNSNLSISSSLAHNTSHGNLAILQRGSIRSRVHTPDSLRVNSDRTTQRRKPGGLGQTRRRPVLGFSTVRMGVSPANGSRFLCWRVCRERRHAKKPAYVIIKKSIDGRSVKVVKPRTPGNGITGVLVRLDGHYALFL